MFARMTGLRHLLLDLDYVVHEGHMPREAIDLTPFTNLTKLTLVRRSNEVLVSLTFALEVWNKIRLAQGLASQS